MNNRVLKNASWVIAARVVQAVLTLVISMLTARYLGPSDFGVINYAASLATFAAPIAMLGLNGILIHEEVNHPEEEGAVFGTAMVLGAVSAFFCIVGIAAVSYITLAEKNETETIIVCILYSIILIFQCTEMIQYWFQAKLLSKYVAVSSLISYTVVSVYKIILLATGKGVYWFAVSNAFDYMLITLALVFIYRRLGGKRLRFSAKTAVRLFSKSRYYIVSNLMTVIFAQTDRIMIKYMLGNSETGFYSAAVTCATMTSFVFTAIIDSMRAVIFENKKLDEQKYRGSLRLLYSVVIYLSLCQSVGITAFSWLIVRIMYGVEYMAAVPALRIVVWYTTFSYLGAVRNIWILAESKQRYLWMINLSGALMNVVLNWFLIPVWGICGAAFASLVTQIFTNVGMNYIIRPIRENNRMMLESLNPVPLFMLAKQTVRERRDKVKETSR